jgi:ABC-2 type transport system permease protein
VTALDSVRLVAARELKEAFRRKGVWIASLLLLAGSTAAMVLPSVLGSSGPSHYVVAVVGSADAPGLSAALHATEGALGATIRVTRVADTTTAEREVKDGTLALAVVAGDHPELIVRSGDHAGLVAATRQALAVAVLGQRLGQAGLTPQQVQGALAVPVPHLLEIDPQRNDRRGAAFGVSLVLYLLLITLMVQVANGTASEKSNRISEVLLPIVRPGALLFGKVVGISVAGLCALAAGILPVVVKLLLGGDLPHGIGGALIGSGAWFALGIVLYLTLAGTLGALVERQEEAGSAVAPLTAMLVGTFVATQSGTDNALSAVLAYVPFSAPLMVPARLAAGTSSPLEIVLSLAILLVSIAIVGRFGSTVYARAIVRTGRRLHLRDVLRPS